MKNNIETQKQELAGSTDDLRYQKYLELVNRQPRKEVVKYNKISDSNYVPIRILEDQLTFLHDGLWSWEIADVKVMGNSIVTTGHLKVFHPIHKVWLTRSGVGAVPIQQNKDASPDDFSQIKITAIHKNAPSSASFAFRSAAKKFGKIFGSTLNNRDDEFITLNSSINQAMNASLEKQSAQKPISDDDFEKFIRAGKDYIQDHINDWEFTDEQTAILESL